MKNPLSKIFNWIDHLDNRNILGIMILIALILRLALAVVLPEDFPRDAMSDRYQYQSIAENILNNRVFGVQPNIPDQYVPPGYPAFVAFVYLLLGQNLVGVRIAQSILGALTILPVFYLARWVYPDRKWIANLSALGVAIHPVLILYCSFQLTETIYIFMTQAFLLSLCLSLDKLRPRKSFVTGLLLGLTLLIREVLAPFVLVTAVLALIRRPGWKKLFTYLFGLILGLGLIISPWLIRNYNTTGRFIFITGRASYAADLVTGSDTSTSGFENLNEEIRQRSEFDAARYATLNQMLNPGFFLSDPDQYFKFVWIRLELTWLHPNGLESLPAGLLRWIYQGANTILLLLAFVGIWAAYKQRRWQTLPMISLWGYTVLVHLFLSTAAPRYSIPVIPTMIILSLSGVFYIWDYWRMKQPDSRADRQV